MIEKTVHQHIISLWELLMNSDTHRRYWRWHLDPISKDLLIRDPAPQNYGPDGDSSLMFRFEQDPPSWVWRNIPIGIVKAYGELPVSPVGSAELSAQSEFVTDPFLRIVSASYRLLSGREVWLDSPLTDPYFTAGLIVAQKET